MGQGSSQIRVRVAVAVTNGCNEILLVRQNNKPFWVLPGGTLEPGETLMQCGERELQEELNMTVECGHLLGLSEFITDSRHVVDTVFVGQWIGEGTDAFKMTDDENLNEVGWFSLHEVENLTVEPQGLWMKVLREWQLGFEKLNEIYLLGKATY